MAYKFITEDKRTLEHIPTGMIFKILMNPVDQQDYDAWSDVYQEFEFKGNKIICKLENSDEFQPDPESGFSKIHAINRRAFKRFKAEVYIEEKLFEEGPTEDEFYVLSKHPNLEITWVIKDKQNGVIIQWTDKHFVDTQDISLTKKIDAKKIPSVLRKVGEWLVLNHKNKI